MKTVSKKLLSLLLVAFLLVSAIPFQAFADAHNDSHKLSPDWTAGPANHWHVCIEEGCDAPNGKYEKQAHSFGADSKCTVCGYTCTHGQTELDPSTAKAPTCKDPGKEADTVCKYCGAVVAAGAVIPATGAHSYVDGFCSVCGATDPNKHDSSTHTLTGFKSDSTKHWQECSVDSCTAKTSGQHFNEAAHTYDSTGKCTVCGYQCNHNNGASFTDKPGTAVAPTCITSGKAADQYCPICGFVHATGATIPATGIHNFDANGNCQTPGCSAKQTGTAYTLTLNPNGGTVNGGTSLSVSVRKNSPISNLPTPERSGFNFVGWFLVDQAGNMTDTQIYAGQNYGYDSDNTVMAKWSNRTQVLTVRRVLNGDLSTAKTIHTANVAEGTPLLNYLNANVASLVSTELSLTPGYRWESNYWRDYSGTQPLTSQTDVMDQAQTIYVNFVSNSYTLYFNANGGTVTPASKTVYFGSAVGTLPTPYKDGFVFLGWKDDSGNILTADSLYNVAGDTSLTAVWKDEALVILYIYINGDFSSCNRMIVMDGYVKNNNISRADVYTEVAKYYTPASGTLKIAGLFDEYTWSSYRANTSKAGTENIQIDDSHINKIYVMVNNASTGSTVLPSTPTTPSTGFWVRDTSGNLTWYPAGSSLPSGTGYWILDGNGNPYIWVITDGTIIPTYIYIGTNPKTGDTAKIEIAAAVMVLAAAALVTIMALRKKKTV